MAKEASFDVVSTVDLQEVDNAYQQARKELAQRYDLKGSGSEIEFDKAGGTIKVSAPSDFVAGQVIDILSSKLVKRGVDLGSVKWGPARTASGGAVVREGDMIEGIDRDVASKINKDIKARKFKVKVQIEGDHLRVSSTSIDTLQDVIAFLKERDYGQPLQYVNYR